MEINKIVVSVCCVTYNHEQYIAECLEGFLKQKVNFNIEILVHDDASTDKTASLIRAYQIKNPNKIISILQKENQWVQKNINPLTEILLPIVKGKYIALCEGDDYWTDPLKLQKQVDFLENNNGYAICAHNVIELNTFSGLETLKPSNTKLLNYNLDNYIINNKTATCSLLFKKEYLDIVLPEWFYKVSFGDWAILLIVLKKSGKLCGVLPDIMATYRIHANGIHSNYYQDSKTFRKAFKQHISFIKTVQKELLFEKKHKPLIIKKLIKTHRRLYRLNLECKNFVMAFTHQIKSMYYKVQLKITLINY